MTGKIPQPVPLTIPSTKVRSTRTHYSLETLRGGSLPLKHMQRIRFVNGITKKPPIISVSKPQLTRVEMDHRYREETPCCYRSPTIPLGSEIDHSHSRTNTLTQPSIGAIGIQTELHRDDLPCREETPRYDRSPTIPPATKTVASNFVRIFE